MFDYRSNEEMQLVPLSMAPKAGASWQKPGKGWLFVKPSLWARFWAFVKGL